MLTARPSAVIACGLIVASLTARPAHAQLHDPLIYAVSRTPESLFDTPRAALVITADDLRRKNPRTLAEALMQEAGVFVQQTNYGGGAPIIRGLMGNQVLILVDGVKLNNATYRYGPLQYLNTIDLNLVDRIEIVRGVGSVLGSDALGGVINVITRKGPAGTGDRSLAASISGRYSSADAGAVAHGEVGGRGDRYRYLAGGSYRDFQDLHGGGAVGLQRATGYGEKSLFTGADYFLSDDRTLGAGYQYLEQNQVPRTDRIANGTDLLFEFDPQRLNLAHLTYQDLTDRGWSDDLQATLYLNRQLEDRHEIRRDAPSTKRLYHDQQTVWGLNLELGSYVGAHRLLYGTDFSSESIISRRNDLDLETGALAAQRGRYTDGATYRSLAVYLQDDHEYLRRRLRATVGVRYQYFASGGEEASSVGTLNLDAARRDLTGALSLRLRVTESLALLGSLTHGFRAPNLDDLSVFNERPDGTEVPNTGIESEHIHQHEIGVKLRGRRFSGSAFVYHSVLHDLLVRAPGTAGGLPFFDLDGDGVQDDGEANVLLRQNIGKAHLLGVELDGSWVLEPGLTARGNLTYTRGEDDYAAEPMRRIPPLFGAFSLLWSSDRKAEPWVEGVYHFAVAQHRLSAGDLADYRIGPEGTAGFNVFDLRGGLTIAGGLGLTVALENVTDALYKHHGSGISRPGRQIVVGARFEP